MKSKEGSLLTWKRKKAGKVEREGEGSILLSQQGFHLPTQLVAQITDQYLHTVAAEWRHLFMAYLPMARRSNAHDIHHSQHTHTPA